MGGEVLTEDTGDICCNAFLLFFFTQLHCQGTFTQTSRKSCFQGVKRTSDTISSHNNLASWLFIKESVNGVGGGYYFCVGKPSNRSSILATPCSYHIRGLSVDYNYNYMCSLNGKVFYAITYNLLIYVLIICVFLTRFGSVIITESVQE